MTDEHQQALKGRYVVGEGVEIILGGRDDCIYQTINATLSYFHIEEIPTTEDKVIHFCKS